MKAALILSLILSVTLAMAARGELKQFDAKYWTIYTDLPADDAREAVLRLSVLAGTYREMMHAMLPPPRGKLPFYLYADEAEYRNAGGSKGTAGAFTGDKLMAVAGPRADLRTWQVVQHEAFHQFAHASIAVTLPAWLEEGLGEYLGEMLFTGDSYIAGIVPTWRKMRVQEEIRGGKFMRLSELLR